MTAAELAEALHVPPNRIYQIIKGTRAMTADTALRLQHTVEGLSVIAISYYVLELMAYLTTPLAEAWHLPKVWMMAGSVPVVLLLVWLGIRRLKARLR